MIDSFWRILSQNDNDSFETLVNEIGWELVLEIQKEKYAIFLRRL
ncbi:MAG: hypothetical protein ACJA2C_000729 [Marinoscillum sp.]|jgi:hypothetical protein